MKAINIKQLYKKHTIVEELTIERNNKSIYLERVLKPDAVCGIVYDTKKEKYILIEQYYLMLQYHNYYLYY